VTSRRGAIAIHTSIAALLLPTHERHRQRRISIDGQFSMSLMRHFLAVGSLAIGVIEPALTALLVPPAGSSKRLSPRDS
jgi:hypothetical protein